MPGVGALAAQGRRPLLLKYGQDLPFAGWFTANAAHAGTRPFDGVFLYLTTSSNDVFKPDVTLAEATVLSEMSGFHAAALGNLTHNFPVVRITTLPPDLPTWASDSDWAQICTNIGAFTSGVQGSRVAGIAIDNEHYYDVGVYPDGPSLFDWETDSPLNVGLDLAATRLLALQRGEELMDAIRAEWPDATVIMLHGPYISDPRTGTTVWTDQSTDPPFWNPVDFANELSGMFTLGMARSAKSTPAKVYDGGEVYAVRSLAHMRNVRNWQLYGLPTGTTIVPSDLQDAAYNLRAAQGLMDNDQFADPPFSAPQAAADIQAEIEAAMSISPITWYYTEGQDWWEGGWGSHIDIDDASMDDYWNAVNVGWHRGRRLPDPELRDTVDYGPWNPETSSGSTVTYTEATDDLDLALSASGGFTAYARAVRDDTTGADGEWTGSVLFDGSEEKFASFHFRGDADWGGTNDQMVDGWRIMWSLAGWWLYKRVAGSETAIFTVATSPAGTTQQFRVRLSGSDIRVKVWTGSEPANWSATVVDSALSTQTRVAVSLGGGAGTEATRNVVFSDITYSATPSTIPFAFAQELGSNASTNATGPPNTMSVTVPATVGEKPMPGDLIVIRVARDNIASDPLTGDSVSATPGGETYTRVPTGQNVASAAGGIVVLTFFAVVQTAWPQGANTVTVTMATGAADRSMTVTHFRSSGAATQRGATDAANGSATAAQALSITTTDPVAGDLVLATGGFELNNASGLTGDSDTTNGTWSAVLGPIESATGGTAASRVKVWGQYKFVTATGNQTYNFSNTAAGDYAAHLITIQPGA